MVLSVTLNPCVDHVLFVEGLKPHDTNRVVRDEVDAGGKGVNLSRVVAELGGETLATGFLGGSPGLYIRSVLAAQGVQNSFIEVAGTTRTNFSVEDGSGKPPTTLNERGPTIGTHEWEDLVAWVDEAAHRSKWVAFGGSMPPGVPADAFRILVDVAKAAGARVVLDADGDPMVEGLKARPDFIKPNDREAERLLGHPVPDEAACLDAASELLDHLGGPDPIAVISRAEKGAVLATRAGRWIGRTPPVEARSTIGSGDSLIAGMLWALGEGMSVEEAFRWGMAAGAATAVTDGSEIARRPVVELLLAEAQVTPAP